MLWNDETEKIMIEWAEKAFCMRSLHNMVKRDVFDTITIAASGINGCLNFAILIISSNYIREILLIVAGALNLFILFGSSFQKVKKGSDTDVEHRISSMYWDKLHRRIKNELLKTRENRMDYKMMLYLNHYEYDKLVESSPPIPAKVLNEFKEKTKQNISINID